MARYLYSELSSLIQARANCQAKQHGDSETWANRHEDMAEQLVKDHMPSGSGFNAGTKLDWDRSHAEKLVFTTAFHHMDENGYYSGWTEHEVIVTPSLAHGYRLRVTGRNRNDIKEYIYETFNSALATDVEWDVVQTWPRCAEMGVAIQSRWIDQCHMVFDVVKGTGIGPKELVATCDTRGDETYQGTALEKARAIAVRTVKGY